MKHRPIARQRGFTLMETVIAIGVLAVLLTGFVLVFTPAAEGIKRVISDQEAERLASTLEKELVTLRTGDESPTISSGFEKGFEWLRDSNIANKALLVFQYRGNPNSIRADGTPDPVPDIEGKTPGTDYVVQSIVRRPDHANLAGDLAAVEGGVYFVKCTQLVFNNGTLKTGTAGTIADPRTGTAAASADAYPDAVIAFSADFHRLASKDPNYISSNAFSEKFQNSGKPVFSRNIAIRR